ncbi:MAG: hypothetical protein JNK09_00830 [Prolixibacteraceae bacterium]|nr:hypothetical protein [Prolixibacteraceae bacterium]
MKTRLFALLSLILFITLNTNTFAGKLLRLNLQKGSIYEMTMTAANQIDQEMMGQKMKIDQKMEMVFSYKVLDVLSDQKFVVEYSFQKMKIDMNMNGQEMKMSTESTDNNPTDVGLKELLSLKLIMTVNQFGLVEKVEGLNEYAQKLSGNRQLSQAMQMFTSEENFKNYFAQTFNYFPEKEVSVGDQWKTSVKVPTLMNTVIEMVYAVTVIEKDMVYLDFLSNVDTNSQIEQMGMKMDVKMAGKQSGKMIINAADGWLTGSDLTQKFDMNMKMKNPQTGEDMTIPMVINSVVNITVVKK